MMSTGTATHQIAVLGAIGNGRLTVEQIAAHLPMLRRKVSNAACRLVARGLVERIDTGVFQLSASGREFLEAGRPLKSGPRGPLTGTRPPQSDTLYQRAWKAMQILRRFTIPDLIRAASTPADRNPASNLQKFIRALVQSGYVAVLPTRVPGSSPTSNGYRQWSLVRNSGPIAPVARPTSRATYDHNLRQVFPWNA